MEQSRAHGATLSYTTHTSHTQAYPYVCAYMSAHSSASILQAMGQKCQPHSRAQAVLNVAVTKHEPSYAMLEESHKQHEAQKVQGILHTAFIKDYVNQGHCFVSIWEQENEKERDFICVGDNVRVCERVSEWMSVCWMSKCIVLHAISPSLP